jgi:hypothetical protein
MGCTPRFEGKRWGAYIFRTLGRLQKMETKNGGTKMGKILSKINYVMLIYI